MNNPASQSLFSSSSAAEQPKSDLIPDGTLSFAVISLSDKGMTYSSRTEGRMANMVATLHSNPAVHKRKIFFYLADIFDDNNGEDFKRMTKAAICRICEASGLFKPSEPESYKALEGMSFDEIIDTISGLDGAIEISMKKGTGGYTDKNDIKNWLTPSTDPKSARGKASWDLLCGGIFTTVKAKPVGGPAAVAGVAKSGGIAKPVSPAALAAQALLGKAGTTAPAGLPSPAGGLKRPPTPTGPGMFGGAALPKPPTTKPVDESNPPDSAPEDDEAPAF